MKSVRGGGMSSVYWPNGEILTYTLYKQADRVSEGGHKSIG
jgi:hypothetical protein